MEWLKQFGVLCLMFSLVACGSGSSDEVVIGGTPTKMLFGRDVNEKEWQEGIREAMLLRALNRVESMFGCVMYNATSSQEGGSLSSATNVQEKGVDEADLIKSDGRYVYAIVGQDVQIHQVQGAELLPVSNIAFEDGISPQGLLLENDKLVVILDSNFQVEWRIYDVHQPNQPQLFERHSEYGQLLSVRRVDEQLFFALKHDLSDRLMNEFLLQDLEVEPCSVPYNEQAETVARLQEKVSEKIALLSSDELIAYAGFAENVGTKRHFYQSSLNSEVQSGVISLVGDSMMQADDVVESVHIFGNGGTMYMSLANIYIAEPASPEDETIIHKFTVGKETLAYQISTKISGHLLDGDFVGSAGDFQMSSFAMSEWQNHLRVATTSGHVWRGEQNEMPQSQVLTLDQNLAQTGNIAGMGVGERIYAVRFIEDRGYVVTFKKVDPLYVLDLSDATNPRKVGEIKVPGFSTYLHPFGTSRKLIGLGYDADDQGDFAWVQGLKISTFDVESASSVRELDMQEFGGRGSYSPAIDDHHAFTFNEELGLLALPVNLTEDLQGGAMVGETQFEGVLLVSIGQNGTLEELGRIATEAADENSWGWGSAVQRTLFVGARQDPQIVVLTTEGVELHAVR